MGKKCPNFKVVAFFSACLFFSDFYIFYTDGLPLQHIKNSGGVSTKYWRFFGGIRPKKGNKSINTDPK
jgi:hypothetical protein